MVQTTEIVSHQSNPKQVPTTKLIMHLSDSRQQNVIDVITCNYVFKWLRFEPQNCIACHQTLYFIGSRDETKPTPKSMPARN